MDFDGDGQLISFKELELERIIDDSASTKSITFQAKYRGEIAVVRLEKSPFDEETTKMALGGEKLRIDRTLVNDIYSRYKLQAPSSTGVNDVKAIIVCPANETVLAKYSKAEAVFFTETAETYNTLVKRFIGNLLTEQKDYNQWVYNILEGRSEVEHVMYNDTDPDSGFMLTPSLKSSGEQKDLHILAICHRRDIRSLRDLNGKHLPLLKNILENGSRIIKEKYPDHKGQLRSFIHYHPTFYHFHVHFELVEAEDYKCTDRDNLLINVISNISLMPNYYELATLTYPISKASGLYKYLKSTDCFK